MRFDDMLATVLAQPATNEAGRSAKWRQLVDLLAQPGRSPQSAPVEEALAYLRRHRGDLDPSLRKEVANSLAGRRVSPLLLQFFGEDHPSIAIPIFGTVRLSAEEWLDLLPGISMTARSLLRHRRDLDSEVTHALAAFGPSDFVLPTSDAEAPVDSSSPAGGSGETQIRELVARIEAYQKNRAAFAPEAKPAPIQAFRWETGPDGVIIWVEDAPRGPLIGQMIGIAAVPGHHGVDGHAAGAFEKRAPFRDARFTVAGSGAASGDWRISGVPFFEPRQGSFLGYRGNARRPRADEVAAFEAPLGEPVGLFGTNIPAESLRQLVHELRTPLNAIVGFAEMIDGQYMGPAAAHYRSRAREIMQQAGRLLSAVDDLDTAARLETSRMIIDRSPADMVELFDRLQAAYAPVAELRKARLTISIASDLPLAGVEPGVAERMFARMLAATIGLAGEGETIGAGMSVESQGENDMLCLAIDRPQAVDGLTEVSLLDPGYSPEGDWPGAPALGLGFALRLVRNLAQACGGVLVVGEHRFLLYLPIMDRTERTSGLK